MKRVFIVEDEAVVALELKDRLRTLGYEVCGHVARGDAALREIPEVRPDLVLMDVKLGSGINGIEVAERLRSAIDVPVIFLSAYSDAELTERAARSGSAAYIVKPFEARVLAANIELALVRHEATVAVRASEARFRRVVDHISDALIVDDLDGRLTFANDRFLSMFGIPRQELPDVRLEDCVAPAWRAALKARRDRLLARESMTAELELEGVCRDGTIRWVTVKVVLVRDENGAIVGTQAALKDVTERKQAELERRRAEERFASVFHFAPDALLIADEGGNIVLANRMAERTLGYSQDELLGLTIGDLVPGPERRGHAGLYREFIARQRPRMMGWALPRLEALRRDGTTVPVEISLSPFRSGEEGLIVAAIRDVTERTRGEEQRTRLEAQLRQAQKMESLGTLAGGIAHDFNNMLTAIIANVELARGAVAADDPIAAHLDDIASASSRATDLVTQILAFSRQQPTKCVVTSLGIVLDEVAKLLRVTLPAGVQLVVETTDNVPRVFIDPTQIHQVLMNLGTNAWHAIEGTTGRVVLRLDEVFIDAGSTPAARVRPGRHARLRVSDNGKGMDGATVERIFEPFFTTKEIGKGTGLGLAVVHGIIADHGGGIAVDSVLGHGTTFSIFLPEASGPALATAVPAAGPQRCRARAAGR